MAGFNPFKEFRKNQKVALAAVGVMAMISFIILPIIMQLMDTTMGQRQGQIATCRRFKAVIDDATLEGFRSSRAVLASFHEQLYYQLLQAKVPEMELYGLGRLIQDKFQRPLSGEQMIQNWLIGRYANEQGIVISDEAVVEYLREISRGHLTSAMLTDIINNSGISYRQIEALIKEELLQSNMINSEMAVANIYPPTLRWEWFQRMNRQVSAEVAAFPVSAFVDSVGDPSNNVLERFFEDNKYSVYDPALPESGFSSPQRLSIQYLVAHVDQKSLDRVTDEEIRQYYEENKETQYRKPLQQLSLPGLQGSGTPGAGLLPPGFGTGMPAPRNPLPSPPLLPQLNATPAATPTVSEEPAEPASNASKPAEGESAGEKTEEKAAPETPAEEKPTEEKEAKPEEKPQENASLTEETSLYRPVVYQETAAEEAKPENASPETKPEEQKPADPQPEAAKPAEAAKPEVSQPADSTAETTKPEEQKPAETPENKPEESKAEDETPVDLSILYRPLSEVEASIRQTLAYRKNQERLEQVHARMQEYFQEYNKAFGAGKSLPVPPDLAALAKEFDLELVETQEMVTLHEAISLSIARDRIASANLLHLFETSPIPYMPELIQGETAAYVLWVTKEEKRNVPKFADIRDTVLARWKEVKARPEAQKAAERLVEQAKSSQKPLAELLASQSEIKQYKVVETEPFFWKTYGSMTEAIEAQMYGRAPRLGEVREKGVAEGQAMFDNKAILMAGTEFMQAAYALGVGDVGMATDQSESTVYLIRVTGSTPSDDVLLEKFRNASFYEYALAGISEYRYDVYRSWVKRIEDECGFEWVRRPMETDGM